MGYRGRGPNAEPERGDIKREDGCEYSTLDERHVLRLKKHQEMQA